MLRELPEEFLSTIDSEADSVLLRTARFDSANCKSYLFRDCRETLLAHSLDDLPGIFAGIEAALLAGYYVAGFLTYECGGHFEPRALVTDAVAALPGELPLAWFGVFDSPLAFDHSANDTIVLQRPVCHLDRSSQSGVEIFAAPAIAALGISPSEYSERIERIKRYIEAG